MQIEEKDISWLKPDPDNPRWLADDPQIEDAIDKLAASYATEGMIDPVEARLDGTITLGELRWRAAKKVGLKKIPVILYDAPKPRRRQLIEELQTHSWPELATARAVKELRNEIAAEIQGMDVDTMVSTYGLGPGTKASSISPELITAKELGYSDTRQVRRHLSILSRREVEEAVEAGKLGARKANALIEALGDERAAKLIQRAEKEELASLTINKHIQPIKNLPEEAKNLVAETIAPEVTRDMVEEVVIVSEEGYEVPRQRIIALAEEAVRISGYAKSERKFRRRRWREALLGKRKSLHLEKVLSPAEGLLEEFRSVQERVLSWNLAEMGVLTPALYEGAYRIWTRTRDHLDRLMAPWQRVKGKLMPVEQASVEAAGEEVQ